MAPESAVEEWTVEAEPGEEEPAEEAPEFSEPTDTPALTSSPSAATPPAAATADSVRVELAPEPDVEAAKSVGELELEYPARMSPGSSDVVRLSIQIPERLASLSPMTVERVAPPQGAAPSAIGQVASDQATVFIGSEMRVELSSPTFGVTAESPAVQAVAVDRIAEPSWWVWSLVAPERVGSHVLTLKLFLSAEAVQPSWLRAYTVEVIPLSPTAAPVTPSLTPEPTFTPTPIPTPSLSERVREGMVENAAEIIISVVSLLLSGLAWLVGASWRWRKRRRTRIAELEKVLVKAAEGEAEMARAEITELESVRWWQFWRWDD
jgi:hypothetical protein